MSISCVLDRRKSMDDLFAGAVIEGRMAGACS
jgi:hypothetical protein